MFLDLFKFGARLKSLRMKMMFSEQEVAEEIHSTAEVVRELEGAFKVPTVHELADLADLYGVSIEYLLAHKE